MNNSLNEAVEAVDGNSLLLDAAVAVGEGSGDAGIGD